MCPKEDFMPDCADVTPPKNGAVAAPPVADCRKCVAEATALSVTPGYNDTCIPTCESAVGKEDDFTQVQVCKGEVWCVDKYGMEINGTRTTGTTTNCNDAVAKAPEGTACQIALAKATKADADYKPQCDAGANNVYKTKQCYGKDAAKYPYCWCVFKVTSKFVPGTFHDAATEPSYDCEKFQQNFKSYCDTKDKEGWYKDEKDCTRYVKCGSSIFSCQCLQDPSKKPEDQMIYDPKEKLCNFKKSVVKTDPNVCKSGG